MEQSGFGRGVGFVLAILFSAVMGACIVAVLVTEYMEPGRVMSEQARQTLRICALSGALAGLLTWWLQKFASHRSFTVRLLYGLVAYLLVFCALGGLLEAVSNFMLNPAQRDITLTGIYWASLGSFYTFALFVLGSAKPGFLAVLMAPGLILAMVGPRTIP